MSYATEELRMALDAIREGDNCRAMNILDDSDHEVAEEVSELLGNNDEDDTALAESMLEQEIDNDDSIFDEYEGE